MSARRSTKFSRKKHFAATQGTVEVEEPLWQFDSDKDVLTVAMEELYSTILQDASYNMTAFNNLSTAVDSQINQSNVCLLIIACVLEKIGMKPAAEKALSESEVVTKIYHDMKLNDKNNLNSLVMLIGILSPELLKNVEMAFFAALARASGKRKIHHGSSRLISTMESMEHAGTQSMFDLAKASVYAGAGVPGMRNIVASRMLEDERDELTQQAAINMGEVPKYNEGVNDNDLMRYIMAAKQGKVNHADFEEYFPTARKPAPVPIKRHRQGLGFAAGVSNDEIEAKDSVSNVGSNASARRLSVQKVRTLGNKEKILSSKERTAEDLIHGFSGLLHDEPVAQVASVPDESIVDI